MKTRHDWDKHLAKTAKEYAFGEGYKILYSPWATLASHRAVFVSLNPGRPPMGADLCVVSDERGNSYEVERTSTNSPITDQFLKMCDLIGLVPGDVLTGVIAPFRSDSWSTLTKLQRDVAIETGREFWSEALKASTARLIIVCSDEAANVVVTLSKATIAEVMPAGWGDVKIVCFKSPSGKRIVKLPHLSRYRLFGRAASEPYLRRALLGL